MIKIWNAFASNNSGSYVIVGSFPTAALAAEVAAELVDVCVAHTAWRKDETVAAPSPLTALAARYQLASGDLDERWTDAWPDSWGGVPDAFAIGRQIFVHVDCTVTMPPLLGHLIYVRGGRVETEIDHAHHPIVTTFSIGIPWKQRDAVDIPARVQAIVDALAARELLQTWHGEPAGFGEPDLVVVGTYPDLAATYAAVRDVVEALGAIVYVAVAEAPAIPCCANTPAVTSAPA